MIVKLLFPFCIAFGLFIYSWQMPLYKNGEAYRQCYQAISETSDAAFTQFDECRDKFLGPRIYLQKYSAVAAILILFAILFFVLGGKSIKALKSRWFISAIGMGAAVIGAISAYPALLYEMENESYPWWADSISIPMGGIVVTMLVYLVVAGFNFLFLQRARDPRGPLFRIDLRWDHKFLLLELLFSLILILDLARIGNFIEMTPMILWVVFFAAILAYRRPEGEKHGTTSTETGYLLGVASASQKSSDS